MEELKTHLVVTDAHAHPDYNNDRAEWVGKLIKDLRPDVVVNNGDMWDFPSLSNYEKGKASFHGRNYQRDVESGLDFDDKLWYNIRRTRKKLPTRYFLEGNHDYRIKRALDVQPELEGHKHGMSFRDLDLDRNYDEVVEYSGGSPGILEIDGILYSHYFVSGVMGRPTGGEHHATSLLSKNYRTSVVGHSHLLDFSQRTDVTGKHIYGLVAGCCQDYEADWAGKQLNQKWWRGVCILHNVEDGQFDLETVSLERLKRSYG